MPREIQEPLVTPDPSPGSRHSTKETHPAYAEIAASRVSGSVVLYGSDFRHHHFMTIRIVPSELNRDLSHDWYFGSVKPYIEVALSEAQWATFVSSPNSSGSPCTLQYLNGQPVPELPDPKSRTEQFSSEAQQKMESALKESKELASAILELPLAAKHKESLIRKIGMLQQQITSNLPFVAKSFDQHMEKTTERAKIEIHAHLQNAIQRLGMNKLSNLQQGQTPFTLIGETDEEET